MGSSCNVSQSEFASTSNECAVAVDATLTRDDLMLTAFTLNGYTLPLNVTFWNISTTFNSAQDTPPDWDTPVLLSISAVEKEDEGTMSTAFLAVVVVLIISGMCFLGVCLFWQKDWSERLNRCCCFPFMLLGACIHTICAGVFYMLCCRCLQQEHSRENPKVGVEETVLNVHPPPPATGVLHTYDNIRPWQCAKCGILNSAQSHYCASSPVGCGAPRLPDSTIFKQMSQGQQDQPNRTPSRTPSRTRRASVGLIRTASGR